MRFASISFCLSLVVLSARASAPTEADARHALRVSAGLASSATGADIGSSGSLAPDGRVSIVDAVLLLRAARGEPVMGYAGTGLLVLHGAVDILNDTHRTFVMTRVPLFQGTLVGASGEPSNGWVEVIGPDGFQVDAMNVSVDGRFRLGVRPGDYTVRMGGPRNAIDPVTGQMASVSQYTEVPLKDHTSDTTRTLVKPEPARLGRIEGTFTAEGFEPTDIHANVKDGGCAQTSFTGNRFSMPCPAGEAILSVSGRYTRAQNVYLSADYASSCVVREGAAVSVAIAAPGFERIEGDVIVEGRPRVATVNFHTHYSADTAFPRYASTCGQNESLDYTHYVAAVPAGSYEVSIQFEDRQPGDARVRRVYYTSATVPEGGGTIDFRLPSLALDKTISGRVTDPSGNPVAGARVSIGGRTAREGDGYETDALMNTDSSGGYAFRMPAGEYWVYIAPPRE